MRNMSHTVHFETLFNQKKYSKIEPGRPENLKKSDLEVQKSNLEVQHPVFQSNLENL